MARRAPATLTVPTNVFGGAPINPIIKKGKKSTEVFSGLELPAALSAVIKLAQGYMAEAMAALKTSLRDRFISDGINLQRRPDNISAEDGIGVASLQLKAAPTELSAEAIALFQTHGIDLEKSVTAPGTFIFNPAYAQDATFLRTLEDALGPAITKLQDERGPLILRQEEQAKMVPSEKGLHQIFSLDEEVIKELFPHAFTIACAPTLDDPKSIKRALEIFLDHHEKSAETLH